MSSNKKAFSAVEADWYGDARSEEESRRLWENAARAHLTEFGLEPGFIDQLFEHELSWGGQGRGCPLNGGGRGSYHAFVFIAAESPELVEKLRAAVHANTDGRVLISARV